MNCWREINEVGEKLNYQPEIVVLKDSKEIAAIAAKEFVFLANQAVKDHKYFSVALSGGSTPKTLFALLAKDSSVPWDKIHFFWGDERHVPPDDPDSNYRMAKEAMLSHIPLCHTCVHRILAEDPDAAHAADLYEHDMKQFFKQFPRFDLALMGMGPDGHTASLFPGTKALNEKERWVVSNWVGKFYTDRITMTAPVFNQAACVMFLVAGDDKAPALKGVLEGPYEPEQLPSQLIRPENGKLLWLVDRAAGKMLEKLDE
ncbi:MAG: 6-phosphogluconolactonase [Acidobacteria bacterium]|nr:MAG: 6-phosphogluconolactonase [Acidobacteriota bacterium]